MARQRLSLLLVQQIEGRDGGGRSCSGGEATAAVADLEIEGMEAATVSPSLPFSTKTATAVTGVRERAAAYLANILPVRETLCARGVEAEGGCCLCNAAPESAIHLFCECTMIFPLWFGLHDFLGGSLLNVIERFIQNVDTFKAVEMAARLWVIWSARNDMLWNDKVWSLEDLRRAVESFLHDWKLAFSPSENMSQVHSVASPAVWHPPPEGWVKCNIDASLRESSMGYGAVLRNHQGHCCKCYARSAKISTFQANMQQ
nr:uncharacterized protein LOC109164732 [Ipomoea batatas]